jgi:hypothetical protein
VLQISMSDKSPMHSSTGLVPICRLVGTYASVAQSRKAITRQSRIGNQSTWQPLINPGINLSGWGRELAMEMRLKIAKTIAEGICRVGIVVVELVVALMMFAPYVTAQVEYVDPTIGNVGNSPGCVFA